VGISNREPLMKETLIRSLPGILMLLRSCWAC
jgi:hypothetical protein